MGFVKLGLFGHTRGKYKGIMVAEGLSEEDGDVWKLFRNFKQG